MTGGYTMAISASGAIAAALTVPVEDAIGHAGAPRSRSGRCPRSSPRRSGSRSRRQARPRARAARRRPAPLWRNRLAWQVTAFMGLQSLLFYSCLSWLPALLRSEGIDRGAAGALLSVMLLTAIPTCLLVPVLASPPAGPARRDRDHAGGQRRRPDRPARRPRRRARGCGRRCSGFAQGALLALAFLFFCLRSPDQEHAAQLSAMAQTVGYAVAAAGPLLLGVLREATGGWTVPVAVLLAMLVPLLAAGMAAGRTRR